MTPAQVARIEALSLAMREESLSQRVASERDEQRARWLRSRGAGRRARKCDECGEAHWSQQPTCYACRQSHLTRRRDTGKGVSPERAEALLRLCEAHYYGFRREDAQQALCIGLDATDKLLARAVRAGILRRVRMGVYSRAES